MRWAFSAALMLIVALLLATNVNAATCSFNAPSADWVNITTSPYTLNITCTPANADGAIYNVTFRYSSDGTTYTTIATVQNSTSDQRTFTYSWDWSSVSDGPYYINATGYEYNVTDGSLLGTGSDQKANIGLDDTPPTVGTPSYTDPIVATDTQTITVTASDTGFTDGVTSCILEVLNNGMVNAQNYTMTDAGTDSFTVSISPAGSGLMKFKVFCTDAHGWNTETSTYTYDTYLTGRKLGIGQPQTVMPEKERSGIIDLIRAFFSWLRGLFS